jgi:hypothetical protein
VQFSPAAQKRIAARGEAKEPFAPSARAAIECVRPLLQAVDSRLTLATITPRFALFAADFASAPWLGHADTPFPVAAELIVPMQRSPVSAGPITRQIKLASEPDFALGTTIAKVQ